jgi:hypothetical protein
MGFTGQAEVPPFGVTWWRQVAAPITKEKFMTQEQASLKLAGAGSDSDGDGSGDEGEGSSLLVD